MMSQVWLALSPTQTLSDFFKETSAAQASGSVDNANDACD